MRINAAVTSKIKRNIYIKGSRWENKKIRSIGMMAMITVLVAIAKAKNNAEVFNALRNKKYKLINNNAIGMTSSCP